MSAEQRERNEQMLLDRVRGDTFESIAQRNGVRHQTAQQVIVREARRHIDALELRLLANRQTGDLEAFLIPDLGGPDFDLAIAYLQWCLRALADRGVRTKVHYRPTDGGVVFGVEDVTKKYSKENE